MFSILYTPFQKVGTIPSQTYTLGIKLYTEKKREKLYTQSWVYNFSRFLLVICYILLDLKKLYTQSWVYNFLRKNRILGFEDVAPRSGKAFEKWFVV